MNEASQIMAFTLGAFAGTLLLAFLVSRLGLYLRRSTRFEPGTLASVHAVSFLILSIAACGSAAATPGSSVLTVFTAQAIVFLIDILRLPRIEDYSDDVPQTLRPLAGARLVAVVASLMLGFGLVYAVARPASDMDLIAETEQGMKQVPGGAIYLEALKRSFPQEYRALAIDSARTLRAIRGGRGEGMSEQQLGEHLGRQINAMIASRSAAMAKAPTPALNAYARSMRDHALALQKTSRVACGALVSELVGAETEIRFPPVVHETFARIAAAKLDLARAGLDHPTERPLVLPEAALRQFRDGMRRRVAAETSYLQSGASCRAAIHYYSTIAELPAETSAILIAYDLRTAASPDSASTSAPLPGR